MSATAVPPYTLITDPAVVTAALTDLRNEGEPVVLRGTSDGRGHPALLAGIDDDPLRLVWQCIDAGPAVSTEAGETVQLEAHRRAGCLMSAAMRCDPAAGFALHTCLPQRLTLHHARHDWRARVIPGEMIVAARLTRPGTPGLGGVLVDLSVGGCRLALVDDAAQLTPGEPVNLQLVFPNDHRATFGARVSDVATRIEVGRQAGLVFAGLSDDQARQLWFLTCEIDRETERRRRVRGELRRLAPSALFEL